MNNYLQYVRNTNGGATKANFIADWEPIGQCLWKELCDMGFVWEDSDGKIRLTVAGNNALDGKTP